MIGPGGEASFEWLPTADETVVEAILSTLDRLGQAIVQDAKRLAPVDEGDLVSTIDYELDERTGRITVFAGGRAGTATGKWVDYAGFVEEGTSRTRAQPYLAPAVERMRGVIRV